MKKHKKHKFKKPQTQTGNINNNDLEVSEVSLEPNFSGQNNASSMPAFAKRGFEQAGITAPTQTANPPNQIIQSKNASPFDIEDADYSSDYDYEEEDFSSFTDFSEVDEDIEALNQLENLEDDELNSSGDIISTAKVVVNKPREVSGKIVKVLAVKFSKNPKTYYFAPMGVEFNKGDGVVVETERGVEYAIVQKRPFDIDEALLPKALKSVIRKADTADLEKLNSFNVAYPNIKIEANKLAKDNGLDMNIVDAEYTLDAQKLVLYFNADGRVDFRELIKKLAGHFKARIELKQIGPRDEVRQKGGLGMCGRVCCCNSVMPDYCSVSVRMAKNQGISLNPQKISGLCGRLMCCLSYENAHYAELNKHLPKMGAKIKTKDGKEGTVVKLMHLKEKVRLKIIEKDSFVFSDYIAGELVFKSRAEREADGEIVKPSIKPNDKKGKRKNNK